MIEHFIDDDHGYVEWNRTHFHGFVLNSYRQPTARYLMVHRAHCRTITGTPANGRTWTHDPIKVCADSLAELDGWAVDRTGAQPTRCDTCTP